MTHSVLIPAASNVSKTISGEIARRGDSAPVDFTPHGVWHRMRHCSVMPAKVPWALLPRGSAPAQTPHRLLWLVRQQRNCVLRPDPDHSLPAQPDTRISGADSHGKPSFGLPSAKPFLGAEPSEAARGRWRCKAREFAIKEICVAGECEVSWERPFYWAPDAVE